MHAYLHCLSHSPLVGYVDPAQEVLDEVNGVIASARERIAAFSPELVVLFAPDHYNGFFYDVMPPFCLGVGATAIGDFGSAAGELPVPVELAEACAHAVMKSGIDLAVSYCMQVDHGFAQPLEFLLGGWIRCQFCLCSSTVSPRRCPVSSVPACWVKPLDVSPALSINACCSWVPVGFPISRRCPNWRKPMPICATVCWGAGKIYPPVSANCVSNG